MSKRAEKGKNNFLMNWTFSIGYYPIFLDKYIKHLGKDYFMINVGLYYRVKKGHEEDFEKAFQGVINFLKTFPGFIDAKLYKRVDDPQEYLIYSEWDSLDTFRRFISSREYKDTTGYGKSILEGMPKHKVLQEINT